MKLTDPKLEALRAGRRRLSPERGHGVTAARAMRKYVVLGVLALAVTAAPMATGGAERATGTLDIAVSGAGSASAQTRSAAARSSSGR